MWECYSYGERPYSNLTNIETVLAVGTGRHLPCPAHCPAAIFSLMKSMWALKPTGRPEIQDVVAALSSDQGAAQLGSQVSSLHDSLSSLPSPPGAMQVGGR